MVVSLTGTGWQARKIALASVINANLGRSLKLGGVARHRDGVRLLPCPELTLLLLKLSANHVFFTFYLGTFYFESVIAARL